MRPRKKQNIPEVEKNWVSSFSLILLIIFISISLFWHGLLFKPEYLLIEGCLYVSAGLILFRCKMPSHPVFYVFIVFVCLYFALTFSAISKQESLATSFRIALVIPLFLIAAQLTKAHRLTLIRVFVYLCSVGLVYGILFDQFRDGRFEGPLEYANAWGVLLLTALILSNMLAAIENKTHYIWLSSLLASGIILSGSRTVLLLFVIIVPLQYWAFGKNDRKTIPSVTLAICAGVASAVTYSFSKWAFLGSVLIVALLILYVMPKIRTKTISVTMIPIFLAMAVAMLYSNQATSLKRLFQLTPHASEWTSRIGYYKDAWQIIIDSPFLGYGGGAWNILQYHYQTAAYTVLYLHNYWLETWIETGLIGVLLFTTIVILFIWSGLSSYLKSDGSTKIWVASCLAVFGCLLVHSTVDFTFEYPLLFGLWVVFGIFSHTSMVELKPTSDLINKLNGPLRILFSLVLILFSIISIRLSFSEALSTKAEHATSYTEAIELLERSSNLAFIPANQHYTSAYLLLKNYLETTNPVHLTRAAMEINKAFSMNPQDVHVLFLRCQIQYAQGERTQARIELQKLHQQFPFRTDIQTELEKWDHAR
ncbi:O-antigen ligase family protein [Paenibacillus qinlingensis]|uniref:O-antigen ligase family protein n=1 Tax=Paenibacillus qinlingensis TaxID=1837343 RepID=UPI0015632902|nr:O-antigen ligase family protein [Paenibacillus qinlingensis]